MAVVKAELAETAGNKTHVIVNGDNSKDIFITTKDGSKILISEDNYGQPKDIQVNGKGFSALGMRTMGGAKDVYDRPGEPVGSVSTSGSSGNPIRDALLGKGNLSDGDGPLAKLRRGEELTPDEERKIEELMSKTGGRVYRYKPRTGD